MSRPPAPDFHAHHWQQREAWQRSWHALDTAFGRGESFCNTLAAWRADRHAPHQLFYSAFTLEPPSQIDPRIATACLGLLPGVHRILFEQGRVQLTLCIGAIASSTSQLAREIDLPADSICVPDFTDWDVRSIARLCKRGTHITWLHAPKAMPPQLQGTGFQATNTAQTAVYQPHWQAKTSLRSAATPSTSHSSKVVVIGAGLAGSAAAYSLASRGWQVAVLDQGSQLGAGASGLPAGIFATHVSPDNNVLSRITRDGVRATLQRAEHLLERHREWDLAHLLEHRFQGKRQLPQADLWPTAGHEWSTNANTAQRTSGGLATDTPALWHALAGWIQTQALVKAQLSIHGIHTQTQACVAKLVRHHAEWHVLDAHEKVLASAPHIVVATAHGCQDLLDSVDLQARPESLRRPHLPITALRGQVTYGPMNALPAALRNNLPTFPVNGHGSYIGQLKSLAPENQAPYWIVGSSFQRHDLDTRPRAEDQQSNLKQWSELMPAWHDDILHGVDLNQTKAWASVRAALPDRLPAVGALKHPDFQGIQLCTGMGARGISWSVLCGELLAAHLTHEPLPMAASLAQLMAASRFG